MCPRVAFSRHGLGKSTLRAFEGKFGAFVAEFGNGCIWWILEGFDGKMGSGNILLVKVG